ncbi:uncharacterized protein AB675_1733 [Cyphellophora attinorum]|uniref:AB hydrolase-1 domain-containing protein n=1 Tax=Cyphellophora attinorum TaxID=1664694 RepID=A0A0N1H847_9EURO|nr:uncharacterized protein AB675_1733 [Phialophora attinorum]KPI42977.1 hypothetical protein AB675_1733 [Phialophora attinorum]
MNKAADLDGVRIVYDSYGTGDHALVFIHGWCCHADFWTEQKPLMNRYRSIVVEIPGHGRSEAPLGYDYCVENFANAVHAAVRQENIAKVVLLGHSLGAVVASMFLRLHSDMVLGIIYADGPFIPPHCEVSMAKRKVLASMHEDDEQFRAFFASTLGPKLDKDKGQWILDHMGGAPKHMRMNAVTTATLFHSWAYNEVFDIPAVRFYCTFNAADLRWKHHVPQLVDEDWSDGGHFMQMDEPEKFNNRVIDFIDSHQLLQHS